MNLPPFTEAQAFDSNHPHSGFVPYRQESLKGQGRSLRMPEFVALGSCAAYNYASVQKDSQWWNQHKDVFRHQMELKDMRQAFFHWFSIAQYTIPDLAEALEKVKFWDSSKGRSPVLRPKFFWKMDEHADPAKQTSAMLDKVRAGIWSISDAMIQEGKDPERQKEIVREDMDEMKGYCVFDVGVATPLPDQMELAKEQAKAKQFGNNNSNKNGGKSNARNN
jgi:hypothetical protein